MQAFDTGEQGSKLENLTVWGRAREILGGRSRSVNMLVLGIFLVAMSGIVDALGQIASFESSVSIVFVMMGMAAFVWGGMLYMDGK